MKCGSLLLSGLMAAGLATSSMAIADDAHHPGKANPPAAAQAKPAAPEQTVKKMQANVKKLQTQLGRLGKAKDEAEFQKLLAEHMQTMHENMALAEGMAGMDCGMMGTPDMHGMMGQGHDMHGMMGGNMAGDHDAMMQRMQQMERRMEALEQTVKPASAK